ncbi:MAG TPA: hypothetical protein VMI33_19825 [Streptosporangiaceae bacterium]|nr:hypothetical protein [Streptosporangiaceae bacterium]
MPRHLRPIAARAREVASRAGRFARGERLAGGGDGEPRSLLRCVFRADIRTLSPGGAGAPVISGP